MTDRIKDAISISSPTGCGNLHISINFTKHNVPTVQAQLGKNGGCSSAWADAVSELLTIALRSGCPIETIVAKLRGSRCPNLIKQDGIEYTSCGDSIAKAFQLLADHPRMRSLTETGIAEAKHQSDKKEDTKK